MQHRSIRNASPLAAFAALLKSAEPELGGAEIMIVVAHPDDETIGIGGHLRRVSEATIVHATDGAPRNMRDAPEHGFSGWEDYADARYSELAAAMSEAGIGAERLFRLGIPDQEAARNLAPLALQVAGFCRDYKPAFICTHPFEGGHPDHDATAFAVAAACELMRRAGTVPP